MLRYITSKFIVTETKVDWSSGYSAILYCLKIELKCEPNYSMFNFRRDMYNKFNDKSFIDMVKVSLRNLSKIAGNFSKRCLIKEGLKTL